MTDASGIPAGRVDDLLRPEVLAAFDRDCFEREGFWVWEGILTDAGRAQWTTSLQNLQAMNDGGVSGSDWGAIDYRSRGISNPDPEKITAEFLATCYGGSEQMKFMPSGLQSYMYEQGLFDPALTTDGFEWQGIFPEYFPLAYDDFILDVATSHPQVMELFGKLLGERFLIDHVLMLNRTPGSRGRRWHGHPYRQGQHETETPTGSSRSLTTEYLQRQCVRTLCYPEGMGADDGGGEGAKLSSGDRTQGCSFEFTPDVTPTLTAVSPSSGGGGTILTVEVETSADTDALIRAFLVERRRPPTNTSSVFSVLFGDDVPCPLASASSSTTTTNLD